MMRKKKSASHNKEHARHLYIKGEGTQKEIAKIAGVNENTIGRWKDQEGWEEQKETLSTTKQNQLIFLYRIMAKLTAEGDAALNDDDPATNPDTDAIAKLSKSIERLEKQAGIAEILQAVIALIKFVQKEDIEAAKIVSKWGHLFVQEKMSEHNG